MRYCIRHYLKFSDGKDLKENKSVLSYMLLTNGLTQKVCGEHDTLVVRILGYKFFNWVGVKYQLGWIDTSKFLLIYVHPLQENLARKWIYSCTLFERR